MKGDRPVVRLQSGRRIPHTDEGLFVLLAMAGAFDEEPQRGKELPRPTPAPVGPPRPKMPDWLGWTLCVGVSLVLGISLEWLLR